MYDLIQYYFPEIKIEDKFIQNIGCVLWNKKKDVLEFLETYKNKNQGAGIVISMNLYSIYCSEYKDKRRVSKNYFLNILNNTD